MINGYRARPANGAMTLSGDILRVATGAAAGLVSGLVLGPADVAAPPGLLTPRPGGVNQ